MSATVTFTKTCVFDGTVHTIEVDAAKFRRWQGGEHIQTVFPELSDDDREVMISGTCPACWERAFGGVE